MCKKTNKILFAAGLGLALLIYYCATTFPDITMINPKGGPLEKMHEIPLTEVYYDFKDIGVETKEDRCVP